MKKTGKSDEYDRIMDDSRKEKEKIQYWFILTKEGIFMIFQISK